MRDLHPTVKIVNNMPSFASGAAAYWDPGNNEIVVAARTGMVKEAASHEFWHVADTRYGITDDPGFRNAAARDIQNGAVSKLGRAAGVLVDDPEVNGVPVGDAFAEVGVDLDREYGGDSDQTGIAGAMGEAFSNTRAWLSQWVKKNLKSA